MAMESNMYSVRYSRATALTAWMAGVAHVDRRQNVRGTVEGGQTARAGKGAGET